MAENKVKYYVRIDDKYVEADMANAESKVSSSGSKIGSAVKGIGLAVGGALVGATAAAVKFGSEFETSMAKASTLIDTGAVDMGRLEEQILDLSDSTGIAAADLGNSMYNALSAGVDLGEDNATMLAMLESSAKLAKAGFTDIDTALTATAKTMNAYGLEGEAAIDKVQKVLIQTQNKGITTVGELGSVLAQVTPTAAAMGVEFEQVGAALANMTAQGTPTAQATTQLNSLIAELGKNGTTAANNLAKAAEGTEYAGMSFQEMMDAGVPLNDVLNLMGAYADETGVGMLDMFSSIEAGKAALALSGENSAAFTENLAAMGTEADVVGEAFDKVSDTSAEKMNRMLNELKNTAIDLFEQMLPFIEEFLPILQELLSELLPPIMELASALLPILGETLAAILPVITDILESILPVLIELLDALLPIFDAVLTLLQPILDLFIALLQPVLDLISGAITPLIEILKYLIDLAIIPLTLALGYLQGYFGAVFNFVSSQITSSVQTWISLFKNIIDFIKNVFTGNWKGAWENVKNIFKSIADMLGNIFKAPINFIIDLVNGFIGGLNNIKIPSWVPGIGGVGINIPLIPRLKKGLDFVPKDFFPAYLDYGERVLTKEENTAFNAIGGLDGLQAAMELQSHPVNAQNLDDLKINVAFTGTIIAPVEIEGREVARATAPFMGEQLAWEGI